MIIITTAHTVLLVDGGGDEASIRRVESALAARGYQVGTARSLAGAGEYLARGSPDVILLDTQLPDGSGIEFCYRRLSATEIHVLFRTSCESLEELTRALGAGGIIYFEKSAPPSEVAARVDAALRRRAGGINS